jgi:hypothetical protein
MEPRRAPRPRLSFDRLGNGYRATPVNLRCRALFRFPRASAALLAVLVEKFFRQFLFARLAGAQAYGRLAGEEMGVAI